MKSLFYTLLIAAVGIASLLLPLGAKADGLEPIERLRLSIQVETETRCLMGNFDFKSKLLQKQIVNAFEFFQMEPVPATNCKTLGQNFALGIPDEELQQMISNMTKQELLDRRDVLIAKGQEDFEKSGKIFKAVAEGLIYGRLYVLENTPK